MMSGRHAARTTVPVARSVESVKSELRRMGADTFAIEESPSGVRLAFRIKNHHYLFELPAADDAQEERRLWRCMLNWVKATRIHWEETSTPVEQLLLSWIRTPKGATVGAEMKPFLDSGKSADAPLLEWRESR